MNSPLNPTSKHSPAVIPEAVIECAIEWAIQLDYNQPSAKTRAAFEAWLAVDVIHQQAWERVHGLKGFQSNLSGASPALVRDILHSAQARRFSRRQLGRALLVGGCVLSVGWTANRHTPWQRLVADASTGIGEQKTLTLDDGSKIVLNTDTAISVEFSQIERRISVHRGEIQITTGIDTNSALKRPFFVSTSAGQMQALGTRFVVRVEQHKTRVSVQENAVALHPQKSSRAIVQAGQSYWFSATGSEPAALPDFEIDSWVNGAIAVRNMRLADLLAELSRYRRGYIQCDPTVADLRLSGSFLVRDTDTTLQFLTQIQPLQLVYRTRFWVSVRSASTPSKK